MEKFIKSSFSNLLKPLFVLSLAAVLAGWYMRNIWFGWEYMERGSKVVVGLMWLIMLATLPGLLALIIMKARRLERKRTYVAFLCFSIVLCVLDLGGGLIWSIHHYQTSYFITAQTKYYGSFHPLFLPIVFTIDSDGHISIAGEASIVTAVGTFTVGVEEEASLQPEEKSLLLIIRHRENGVIGENAYRIKTEQDEAFIITHGTTSTDITRNKIVIDASGGDIQHIQINAAPADSFVGPGSPNPPQILYNNMRAINGRERDIYAYPRRVARPIFRTLVL